MDDLTGRWAKLSLNTQESQTVPLATDIEDNSKVLVAKLFTKRRASMEALSRTLKSMWRSIQDFELRDLGFNTVLILFSSEADAIKIFAQQPWSFDKYLIGLYKPTAEESVEDAKFNSASFWIQVHNLPFSRMNRANAEAIGRSLGKLQQVDASPTGECRGRYLRIRVDIDISQPLSRGRFVDVGESDPLWISLQYERLPVYCYWCGLLNHDEKDCQTWINSGGSLKKEEQQYGPWLRASIHNVQQPQTVSTKTTQTTPPPPPHRPTPSPSTKPTPPMTNPSEPPPPPPSDTPVTSAPLSKHTPTNLEILSNQDLFHAHITEIDQDINYHPISNPYPIPNPMQVSESHPRAPDIISISEPSKSTFPRKDITTSVGTQNLTSITPAPHISNSHLDANANPSCNTKSLVGPKIGTWRRLGPPAHAMDTSEKNEQVLGPKRKCEDTDPNIAILTEKKQRLNDEAKALGKLMADNLGSAVAATQHRRTQ